MKQWEAGSAGIGPTSDIGQNRGLISMDATLHGVHVSMDLPQTVDWDELEALRVGLFPPRTS